MNKHEYCVVVRRRAGTNMVVAKLCKPDGEGGYIPVATGTSLLGTIGRDAHQAIGRLISFNPGVEPLLGYYNKTRPRLTGEENIALGKRVVEINDADRLFDIHIDTDCNWDEVSA